MIATRNVLKVLGVLEIAFGILFALVLVLISSAVTDPHPTGRLIIWGLPIAFITIPTLSIWLLDAEKPLAVRVGMAGLCLTPLITLLYVFELYG